MLTFALWLVAVPMGLLVFVLFGYPLLLRSRARGRLAPSDVALGRAGAAHDQARWPEVAVMVATRDAPDAIAARVRNLRDAEYPSQHLRIVVAVDARSPYPIAAYASAVAGEAQIVRGDEPGGKAAALNACVRAATGDVLVFADSQQRFSPNAIRDLVTALRGEGVGAVSGMLISAKDDALMDRYWEYELELRRRQSAVHSVICVSGAVYAMRRELWVPMPDALICDDLFVTFGLVLRGWRVGFCEAAHAYDPRQFTRQQHFERKVRTLTGLLQFCAWQPAVLAPWRNAIWVDFATHKLARIILPYLAVLVAIGAWWTTFLLLGARWTLSLAVATAAAAVAVLVARPSLATSALWAAKLATVPLIATRNALGRRWHVWTASPAPAATTPASAPHLSEPAA